MYVKRLVYSRSSINDNHYYYYDFLPSRTMEPPVQIMFIKFFSLKGKFFSHQTRKY